MKIDFPSILFGLIVGVGGGVPSIHADVRLEDVVISQPEKNHGGVVQYDFGKTAPSGFKRTGFLNTPPTVLLHALADFQSDEYLGRSRVMRYLSDIHEHFPLSIRENAGPDILFEATYNHKQGVTCETCSTDKQIRRSPRETQEIRLHFGTIASGNQVIRDGVTRNLLSSELGSVLCFEMEAAGLMNSFPCLIIRGICNYSDSHKNKRWQPYAAAAAAACAKGLLLLIPDWNTKKLRTVNNTVKLISSLFIHRY